MKEGRSSAVSPKPWSPAPNGFQPIAPIVWPDFRPHSARMSVSAGERSRGCPGRREGLVEHALVGAGDELGIAPAFIADQQLRLAAGQDDEQRFLEARIVAGEIGDVGRMLAVAIDDEGVEAGCAAREQRLDARLVGGVAARPASPSARRIREARPSSTRPMRRACELPLPWIRRNGGAIVLGRWPRRARICNSAKRGRRRPRGQHGWD